MDRASSLRRVTRTRTRQQDIGHLLSFLPDHRVVICRECQYAVQPNALSSHLKKHKIFRGQRQDLLQQLVRCDLAPPEQVLDPPPDAPSVPGIPVHQGHKCLSPGCTYLCTAGKRLTQHWSQTHGLSDHRLVVARPAKVQTFFRGTCIRYFEVDGPAQATGTLPNTANGSVGGGALPPDALATATVALPTTLAADTSAAYASTDVGDGAPLNVDAIMYMHHYTTSTAQTMTLGTGCPGYMSDILPKEATKYRYLLYAILGIAACHQAVITKDKTEHNKHKFASLKYQSEGASAYRKAIDTATKDDAVALAATARLLGVQDNVLSGIDYGNTLWNAHSADDAVRALTRHIILLQGCGSMLLKFHQYFPRDCGMRLSPEDLLDMQRVAESNGVSHNGHSILYDDSRDVGAVPPRLVQSVRALPKRLSGIPAISSEDVSWVVQCCGVLLEALILAHGSGDGLEWRIWASSMGFVCSPIVQDVLIPALQRKNLASFVLLALCGKYLPCGLPNSLWFTIGHVDRYLSWCRAGLGDQQSLLSIVDEISQIECERYGLGCPPR